MQYRYIAGIIIAILALWAFGAFGQVVEGQDMLVRAPLCFTKQDAIAIAKVDAKQGPAAAGAMFSNSEKCGVAVVHIKVGKTVFSVKTARGTTKVIEVQVEMADDSWRTLYMLTDK